MILGISKRLATFNDAINNFNKKNKFNIIVFITYIFLTIIFTWPVAFSGDKIPGRSDAFWYLWDLWWFKTALLNFSSPYYTSYIFYPIGINLAFSAITPFNAILSIPLQLLFGLIRAYNILWIFSFIASGYGTYLFVKYLIGDTRAAFISGLIFMFSPYHFAHAFGHLNLTAIEWIPFYTLYLFKTLREKETKYPLYAAFFLFLTALSEYYYLVYVSIFTLIFILYYSWVDKKKIIQIDTLRRFSMMIIVFGLIFFPFAYPLLKELLISNSNYMYSGQSVEYSADLLGFFIPSQFHPIFREYVVSIYKNFSGNFSEYTVFAGYTVIFLAFIAILKIKTKEIKFWTLSTIIFFILSLGPFLHLNGVTTFQIKDYVFSIPLPYSFLMNIPILSIARVPSRWDVLVMLSMAVLSGYGISYLIKRANGKKSFKISHKNLIAFVFSCIILFEFLSIPYLMSSTKVPEFYHQLGNDTENYAIFEIPDLVGHLTFTEYMYYQTVHGKKLITGYTHVPESSLKFKQNTILVNDLHFTYVNPQIPEMKKDILNLNVTELGLSILNYYNIKYIIIHNRYMNKEQLESANNLLRATLKEEPQFYEEDGLLVYKVKKEQLKSFMTLSDNWYGLEHWGNIPIRWTSNNATIFIYSLDNKLSSISFNIMNFDKPKRFQVYLNGKFIGEQNISGLTKIKIPLKLKKNENIIRFNSPEGCQRPLDFPELNNNDPRCLSFAFQNITLT